MSTASLPQQLCELEPGETLARVEKLPMYQTTRGAIADIKRRLRNTATSAISRAKARPGKRAWTMEVSHFLTDAAELCVILLITRTK